MKIILTAFIALFCVLAIFTVCRVCVQVTPSMPYGLYYQTDNIPQRGDIVGFCPTDYAFELAQERDYLSSGQCKNGMRPLLKYLAALPKDKISIEDAAIFCGPQNGIKCRWAIRAKQKDSKGRPLQRRIFTGIVPDNMAVVFTTHDGSYDSRYFGYVPLSDLKVYLPLVTF